MRIPELTTEAKNEIKRLQTKYRAAVQEYEKLKQIEDSAEDQALRELNYIVDEGEPATHKNSFLLDDLELDVMLKRRQQIIQRLGYDYPDPERVFSYDAWNRKRDLEALILKWGEKYTAAAAGLNSEEWDMIASHWKFSQDFIDLTMKLKC